jgi:hypothetical protein
MVGGEGSTPCSRDGSVFRDMILPTMPRLVTQVAPRRKGVYASEEIRDPGCFSYVLKQIWRGHQLIYANAENSDMEQLSSIREFFS